MRFIILTLKSDPDYEKMTLEVFYLKQKNSFEIDFFPSILAKFGMNIPLSKGSQIFCIVLDQNLEEAVPLFPIYEVHKFIDQKKMNILFEKHLLEFSENEILLKSLEEKKEILRIELTADSAAIHLKKPLEIHSDVEFKGSVKIKKTLEVAEKISSDKEIEVQNNKLTELSPHLNTYKTHTHTCPPGIAGGPSTPPL